MKQEQIKRLLQSVGMAFFVKYFALLKDKAISHSALTDMVRSNEGYTESASHTRVSKSRQLIDAGHARAALYMVMQSERMDGSTKKAAKDFFDQLSGA